METFDSWRTYSRRHGVAELLQRLYDDTAYVDFVGAMPGGDVRQANLKALYDRAQQYEDAGFRGLFRYLQLMDKMKEDGLDLAPAKVVSENEDVVRIMSIHKSKGLEFPVVFVADLGKAFNRRDMQDQILFTTAWASASSSMTRNGACLTRRSSGAASRPSCAGKGRPKKNVSSMSP